MAKLTMSEEMQVLCEHFEDVVVKHIDPIKSEILLLSNKVEKSMDKIGNHESELAVIKEKISNEQDNREKADSNVELKLSKEIDKCNKEHKELHDRIDTVLATGKSDLTDSMKTVEANAKGRINTALKIIGFGITGIAGLTGVFFGLLQIMK